MKVLAVAAVTVREVLRRKVQVNLLLFGSALLVASWALSALTIGEMHRMIADLGLSAMRLIGTLLATFLGASLVAGDVDRRVIQPIVTKPISRAEYVFGRYFGLCVAIVANLAAMAALLGTILAVDAHSLRVFDAAFASAIAMMGAQFLLVASIAIFFSSITNVTLASIFALSVAIAGQLTNDMRNLWRSSGNWIAEVVWYVVPNLGALNANEAVIYREAPPSAAWMPVVYAALYSATAVALAAASFERRDLR